MAFLNDDKDGTVRLTYAELDRQARTIGALLQSHGARGERALMLYAPGFGFVAAFFGCLYAGTIAVPTYPPRPQTLARFQVIAEDAQPIVILTTSDILALVEPYLAELRGSRAVRWLATEDLPDGLAEEWQEPAITGNSLAFLQYTSGSTTVPRGVMVTHGNLLHNLKMIHQCFDPTPDSSGVIWLPPYHDMGLIGGLLQPIYAGLSVTLMSPVAFLQRPFRWLEAISRTGATVSGGPNFAYDLCVQKITPEQRATLDLSRWEVAFNGSEPVRPETLERFAAAFEPCGFRREAWYPCYGLAEATLFVTGGLKSALPIIHTVSAPALEQKQVVTASTDEKDTRTLVGCGRVCPDQKMAIVDPDTLTRCPPDQVGEIWVSGPSVAQGYWNRPEETEYTFRAYLADTGEGPWLRTGDLGYRKDGELFITGRLKDLIIIDGRNHYPQDIELTVEESHPALRPNCSAAFSVDAEGIERLVIVAEVAREYLPGRSQVLDVEAVTRAVRQAVSEQHGVPVHDFVLVRTGSISKTTSGKIQRRACRAGYLAGTLNLVDR
jgi:acyl-CoA synthetase (AMP-forming)/AMP-acid ligase II